MRVVLLDAVGQAGTEDLGGRVVRRLAQDPVFDDVIQARWPADRSAFAGLITQMRSADAVVTMPWTATATLRDPIDAWLTRTKRICDAVAEAGVHAYVYGSSSLGYSPTLSDEPVDETWPMIGLTDSGISKVLARADELVHEFELAHPVVRVVRLRPALVVDPARWVASERPFAGFGQRRAEKRVANSAVQLVHVDDVAEAFRLALRESVSGPINLATRPIPLQRLAQCARLLQGNRRRRRWVVGVRSGHMPIPTEWLAVAASSPVVDTTRAERELHWAPSYSADALIDEAEGTTTQGAATVGSPAPYRPAGINDARAASLYGDALAYFGRVVHALGDAEWDRPMWQGATARQLVALSARDQYRASLLLTGSTPEAAESGSPADPLGIDPLDGWELAAERGTLAIDEWSADRPSAPLGETSPAATVLTEACLDLVARGACLAHEMEHPPDLEPSLLALVRERVAVGTSMAPHDAEHMPPSELLAVFLAENAPTETWRGSLSRTHRLVSGF